MGFYGKLNSSNLMVYTVQRVNRQFYPQICSPFFAGIFFQYMVQTGQIIVRDD